MDQIKLHDLSDEDLTKTADNLVAFGDHLLRQGYRHGHWEFPAINSALGLVEKEQARRVAC